jgi:hypothetical protein
MNWSESDLAAYEARRKGEKVPAKPKDALQEIIEAKGFTPSPKASKYGNKKVTVDGVVFHSKREANRWQQLLMMEKAGKIADLQRQVPFVLAPAVVIDGRKKPPLKYVSDFSYMKNGKQVVEDTKSNATRRLAAYRIKKHLMMSVLGIEIVDTTS